MTAAVIGFSAVFGLLIGSFLNVVVYRLPRGESVVRPPSHCPGCDAPVAPRDNIPVLSWLALRGRCRHCANPISIRYPLVELGCAALFAAIAARFVGTPDAGAIPAFLYLAAVGLALALIDLAVKRLPNALTLPSYLVAPLLLLPAALAGPGISAWLRGLAGMAALYVLYWLLWFVGKGRLMGFGDVKLAGVLGCYLGYLGWGPWAVGLLGGFVAGALGGVLLIARGRARMKSQVPYGPYMLVGALLAIFAGTQIASAYVHAALGG